MKPRAILEGAWGLTLIAALVAVAGRPRAESPPPAFELRTFHRAPLGAVSVWAPPPGTPGKFETLVLLHGRQIDAPDPTWMAGLRFEPAFRGRILIVPALAGRDPDWADGANLRAVAALVEEIASRYPVDRRAVYLVGYSAGGSRVLDLAARIPLALAGIASLAGDVTRPWRGPLGPKLPPAPKLLLLCMTEDSGPHTSCALNDANLRLLKKKGVKGVTIEKIPGTHSLDLTRVAPILDSWMTH